MLYHLFKIAMQFTLRLYFGRIQTRNLSLIDQPGPVIILANHTNSFMDAMITGISVRRRIHFFVRGDVFAHPWANRLFRSLGMLPVYRLREGKEKLGLNDRSNREALQVLEQGGALLIFAEGSSEIEKILKPLRKGPFRLAALVTEQTTADLRLVPLGINYLDALRPGTLVWMPAATPIDARSQYREQEGNAARTATALMRRTATQLEEVALYASRPDQAGLLQALLELAVCTAPADQQLSFTTVKAWTQRLNAAAPEESADLEHKMNRYREVLKALGLKYWRHSGGTATDVLLLAAGAIFALAGWLFFLPPLAAARYAADKKVQEVDFYASVFCVAAMLLTVLWYGLTVIAALFVWQPVQVVLGGLLVSAAGIFYLKTYGPALDRVLQSMQQRMLEDKYPQAVSMLKALQDDILEWMQRPEREGGTNP